MKKIFIVLALSCLFACHSNESANSKPTDLDRTNNNDTSAVPKDSSKTVVRDSIGTTHQTP